jgi:LacI family transcriptional regulator
MDDRRAAHEMTGYLLGLGHRHIGFLQGPLSHSASSRREQGFRAALAEAGIAVDEACVLRGDFSFRSGLELGEALLALPEPPRAIFACNDDMALGVLITAMKRGIAVPEQLSICGFDDVASSRAAWPQITTIRQPKAEMAGAAVDILTDPGLRRQGADQAMRLMLPHELIVRGSTGPAT